LSNLLLVWEGAGDGEGDGLVFGVDVDPDFDTIFF